MPAKKRQHAESCVQAVTPDSSGSRRRSQRINLSAKKPKYVDSASEPGDFIAKSFGRNRRKRWIEESDKVDMKDKDSDDDDGQEEMSEDSEVPNKRGRPRAVVQSGDETRTSRSTINKKSAFISRLEPQNVKMRRMVTKKASDDEKDEYAETDKISFSDDDDDDDDEEEEEKEEEEEEEDSDIEPQVIVQKIPAVRLMDDGGVPYLDNTVHPNTLAFLRQLKAHNNRAWLKAHDAEYRRSLRDWTSFVDALSERISEIDDTVPPELPAKDLVFRIYRDIRFSHDPTPYKAHYSAAWSRTGKKGPYACYYVHLEPEEEEDGRPGRKASNSKKNDTATGSCENKNKPKSASYGGHTFVGGGLWHPDAGQLAALRASIDERPHAWDRLFRDHDFRRLLFFPSHNQIDIDKEYDEDENEADVRAAKRAFCIRNADNALKTKPKGFQSEHRDIELLKLRNFTVGRHIRSRDLTGERALDTVGEVVKGMKTFIHHLNRIVMPDSGDADEDEGGSENEDDEDGE